MLFFYFPKICTNNDQPPEVEVRFDFQKKEYFRKIEDGCNNEIYEKERKNSQNMIKIENENESENRNENENENDSFMEKISDINFEEYDNWQLKFVHNQLFENLKNSNRFCPGFR